MKSLTTELALDHAVTWVGPLTHGRLPAALAQADLFIHDGATNSLDKTLVEAAFAGCTVISSNPSYRGLTAAIAPDLLFAPKDHQQLADIIANQPQSDSHPIAAVRKELLRTCSLPGLVSGIVSKFN
jgi:glycosyltransferase involved in cell wall biosynthesis